jgi:hypothetical protein
LGTILQVFVILGQCSFRGLLELLFDLLLPVGVHDHLWGEQSRHGDKLEVGVSNQLAGQPEERLLKVVIALSTNVVVLKLEIKKLGWFIKIKSIKLISNFRLEGQLIASQNSVVSNFFLIMLIIKNTLGA